MFQPISVGNLNKIVIWEENGMIYVAICKECQEKHADVIEKNAQKDAFSL